MRKLQISQYKAVNITTDSFSLHSIMVSLRLYREEIALFSNPKLLSRGMELPNMNAGDL